MSSGELSHVEKAHLAEALQWHGLPTDTALHLLAQEHMHIVDSIVTVRVASTMVGASPSAIGRALAMIKPMMLARAKFIYERDARRARSALALAKRESAERESA